MMWDADAVEEVVGCDSDSETVRIWCVCDSAGGGVESYHPSYAWAQDQVTRDGKARPVTMQAIVRAVKATFRGEAFRVVTSVWDRYCSTLLVAAECPDIASREFVLRHAALNAGRSRRKVRVEMRRLKLGQKPERRLPAHVLDLPELVTMVADDYRQEPILSRSEAMEQAAQRNRQYLAQAATWSGQWCLVVELSDPLPDTLVSPEFAGPLGVESRVTHRAMRLVRPTEVEVERFAGEAVTVH